MNIPKALIILRLFLAPVIIALAYYLGDTARIIIVVLMHLGLFSDILDGIIARKQNISSEKLRRMDSQIDMVFWLSIGFAAWLLSPKLIADNAIVILAIIFLEIACYGISLLKFKKETCTHSFLSKIWGLGLAVAMTSIIGFNHAGIPFVLAMVLGLLSYIDVILITLLLPKWQHDIPSAYHAYLIRKGIPIKKNPYLNG